MASIGLALHWCFDGLALHWRFALSLALALALLTALAMALALLTAAALLLQLLPMTADHRTHHALSHRIDDAFLANG